MAYQEGRWFKIWNMGSDHWTDHWTFLWLARYPDRPFPWCIYWRTCSRHPLIKSNEYCMQVIHRLHAYKRTEICIWSLPVGNDNQEQLEHPVLKTKSLTQQKTHCQIGSASFVYSGVGLHHWWSHSCRRCHTRRWSHSRGRCHAFGHTILSGTFALVTVFTACVVELIREIQHTIAVDGITL